MKTFPIAPGVLLVFILSVYLGAASRGSDVARYCCLRFNHKTLPLKTIQTFEFTRNSCSLRAVIFTTRRGQKVCANPKEEWVKKHISLLQAQKRL